MKVNLRKRPVFAKHSELYIYHDFQKGCLGNIFGKDGVNLWGLVDLPNQPVAPLCYLRPGSWILAIDLIVPDGYPDEVGPCIWIQFECEKKHRGRLEVHLTEMREWSDVHVEFLDTNKNSLFRGRVPLLHDAEPNPFRVTFTGGLG